MPLRGTAQRRIGGHIMRQTSIWNYIWVGTCLRYLQDQKVGIPAKNPGCTVDNLKSFFTSLDELGLHVTKRAAYDLASIDSDFEKKPADYKLTADDVEKITKAATKVRDTFEAETGGVFTYAVTDKRLDIRKLLEDVSQLFAPKVYDLCPVVARYDFSEAGKCIAFERSTAAAFHILRATEAVLRLYYKRYIRPAQQDLTWGQMTHALANKNKGKKPDTVILNNLNHIRIGFRNPTQHPDKIYDIQEVQDLFGLCVDCINRMIAAVSK